MEVQGVDPFPSESCRSFAHPTIWEHEPKEGQHRNDEPGKSFSLFGNDHAMANEEHLNLLLQGLEVWNRFRRTRPEVQPDLREADLSGYDFTRIDLSKADLAGADLSDAYLVRANLEEANLTGANLMEADLIEANLIKATLTKATLVRADLSSSGLIRAHLAEADLSGANLTRTSLPWAILSQSNLSKATLHLTDLREALLIGADLSEANLQGASLTGTNLQGANLRGVKKYRAIGKSKNSLPNPIGSSHQGTTGKRLSSPFHPTHRLGGCPGQGTKPRPFTSSHREKGRGLKKGEGVRFAGRIF